MHATIATKERVFLYIYYLFSISTFSHFNVKRESFWSYDVFLSLDKIETNMNSHLWTARPHAVCPHVEKYWSMNSSEIWRTSREYLLMNNIRYAILKTHYVASKPSPLAFSKMYRRRALVRHASWAGERGRERGRERERNKEKVPLNKYFGYNEVDGMHIRWRRRRP